MPAAQNDTSLLSYLQVCGVLAWLSYCMLLTLGVRLDSLLLGVFILDPKARGHTQETFHAKVENQRYKALSACLLSANAPSIKQSPRLSLEGVRKV